MGSTAGGGQSERQGGMIARKGTKKKMKARSGFNCNLRAFPPSSRLRVTNLPLHGVLD
jgi:hypothetical protein